MTRIEYITTPEDTPDIRNDTFYENISRNWKKRAQNLQDRRWEKIENRRRV